ncbi:unnamed protein product [Caenorhabditis brenneri]
MSLSKLKQFLKEALFEDVTKESEFQKSILLNENSLRTTWDVQEREWEVTLKKCGNGSLEVKIESFRATFGTEKHIEFKYGIVLTHNNSLKFNRIFLHGNANINEESSTIFTGYHKLPILHRLCGVSFKNMYMAFHPDILVFHDNCNIRNLYLTPQALDPESLIIDVGGREISLPALKRRSPLLLKALEENEVSEILGNHLEVFFQLMYGVLIQLESWFPVAFLNKFMISRD